jgi:hypothetical protein
MDKIAEMTRESSSCVHGGLRVWLRVVEAADVLLEVDMVDGGVMRGRGVSNSSPDHKPSSTQTHRLEVNDGVGERARLNIKFV